MIISGSQPIIDKARLRMSLNQLAKELSKLAGRTIHRSQVQRWSKGKGITTRNLNLLLEYSIQERKPHGRPRNPIDPPTPDR